MYPEAGTQMTMILEKSDAAVGQNVRVQNPNPLDVALGGRIRQRRRELGFSQDQLARKVGLTFQQVQKYEHGTNRVSFSRLVAIAQALDCRVMDIVGDLDLL
jgi:DNA-binding XRE family transcriptional regulator